MDRDFEIISGIYNSFDPFRPLEPGDPAYVECREVRGDTNVEQGLGKRIIFARVDDNNDDNTCQLYTGHRGGREIYRIIALKTVFERKRLFCCLF